MLVLTLKYEFDLPTVNILILPVSCRWWPKLKAEHRTDITYCLKENSVIFASYDKKRSYMRNREAHENQRKIK
jgi:hypothetical protein